MSNQGHKGSKIWQFCQEEVKLSGDITVVFLGMICPVSMVYATSTSYKLRLKSVLKHFSELLLCLKLDAWGDF